MRTAAWDAWVERARAVRIESELTRRGIRLRGNGIERAGPCPVCGGDDRFSINTHKQVFFCRGCGGKGDVIDLVELLDGTDFAHAVETLAGAPPPQSNGKNEKGPNAREVVVAIYHYRDADGALSFAVERIEFELPDGSFMMKDGKRHKIFKQKRPDPDHPGMWIPNVNGVPPLIYHLPQVTEALAAGQQILIVEGEAKADLLWSWNVPATCCSQGAGKWRSEHSQQLRGADIVILPDNDASGRKHRDIVARSLSGIASRIQVLTLPGLAEKDDIRDWAAAGGTVDALHDLIVEAAKPWTPQEVTEGNGGDADAEQGIGEWNAGLDIELPPPRGWLLGNIFCRCFISSLFADGGVPPHGIEITAVSAIFWHDHRSAHRKRLLRPAKWGRTANR
jgi:hypothetical protein